jgi:hypothetical protein
LRGPKRVFLSYAWEDDSYRSWVKQLAVRLREDGVEARLDAWDLVDTDHLGEFMGREVRLANWVLVLCSPSYQSKVRATEEGARVAGVGWEMRLLSGRMLADNERKVLAALARGTWTEAAPDELKGQVHFDLSNPATFEGEYRRLLQAITGTSERAPALGQPPPGLRDDPAVALRGPSESSGRTASATGLAGERQPGSPAHPVATIVVIALVVDVALAWFVTSVLAFTTTGFLQFCALFIPVAVACAVLLNFLALAVRRWRVAKS